MGGRGGGVIVQGKLFRSNCPGGNFPGGTFIGEFVRKLVV